VDYFRRFYEHFEEKVSDFLFVKCGSVIIFQFWYNLVANFAREYESSHGRFSHVSYFFIVLIMCPNYSLDGLLMTIDHFTVYTVYKVFYVYYFKAGQIINGDWRKLIIKYFNL
jgi:hypothetical protein